MTLIKAPCARWVLFGLYAIGCCVLFGVSCLVAAGAGPEAVRPAVQACVTDTVAGFGAVVGALVSGQGKGRVIPVWLLVLAVLAVAGLFCNTAVPLFGRIGVPFDPSGLQADTRIWVPVWSVLANAAIVVGVVGKSDAGDDDGG